MTPICFKRHNRNSRTVLILIAVYAALGSLVIFLDAAWWLVGFLSLATLPAVWDVVHDTSAGLTLDDKYLRWHSGKRQGAVPMQDVDFFRFDTRWDFSVRVSLVLVNGKRIRLPDESIPPHQQFETLLQQAGYRVKRHHFTVF